MRPLSYWKARKIDIRLALANTDKRSEYYAELCQAYLYATQKERELEKRILKI